MPETAPHLTIVVAMTRDRVIGSGGRTPWHLPEELRLFKRLTMGGTVIMGRRTFEAIGRPLPGRHNLVLSTTLAAGPGIEVCADFDRAVARARQLGAAIYVIGGRRVYRQALKIAGQLYVSWIEGDFAGDVKFPAWAMDDWQVVGEESFEKFRLVRYRKLPR